MGMTAQSCFTESQDGWLFMQSLYAQYNHEFIVVPLLFQVIGSERYKKNYINFVIFGDKCSTPSH